MWITCTNWKDRTLKNDSFTRRTSLVQSSFSRTNTYDPVKHVINNTNKHVLYLHNEKSSSVCCYINIQDAFDNIIVIRQYGEHRPQASAQPTSARLVQRHLPSSPSRRFGGGISMIFFKTTGKAGEGLSEPASIVTETVSTSILTDAVVPRVRIA